MNSGERSLRRFLIYRSKTYGSKIFGSSHHCSRSLGALPHHSLQPDLGHCAETHVLDVKLLITFSAEQFLHPRVIDDHAQKATRRKHRIHLP